MPIYCWIWKTRRATGEDNEWCQCCHWVCQWPNLSQGTGAKMLPLQCGYIHGSSVFFFLYAFILSLFKTHHRQVDSFKTLAGAFSVLPKNLDFPGLVSCQSGQCRGRITQIYVHLPGDAQLVCPVPLFWVTNLTGINGFLIPQIKNTYCSFARLNWQVQIDY